MTLGIPVRRWRAAFAFACVLALAPAAAQAQQPPATAQQGYPGIELRSLSREDAQEQGMPGAGGAAITKVEAESPAATAGLKYGDILVMTGGKPIASAAQVLKLTASMAPGAIIKFRVLRQGKLRTEPVKLGAKRGASAIMQARAAGSGVAEPAP